MTPSTTRLTDPDLFTSPASYAFPGAGERAGLESEEAGQDPEELRLIGVIRRGGLLTTEVFDADWE